MAEFLAFTLIWRGLEIEASYRTNWLDTGHTHIELRCQDRLPVTETGYRSLFVPEAELVDEGHIRARLQSWLDEAALSPEWQCYRDDSRQMTLF
jgi:hypothetical protein